MGHMERTGLTQPWGTGGVHRHSSWKNHPRAPCKTDPQNVIITVCEQAGQREENGGSERKNRKSKDARRPEGRQTRRQSRSTMVYHWAIFHVSQSPRK